MIRIELAQTEIRVGETLTGQVVWNAGGGKQPRKIVVAVHWIASGKGDRRKVEVMQMSDEDVASKSQIVVPLSVEIPFGPLTYDGKVFKISWEVSARADLPFAIDETEKMAFVVRPAIWSLDQFQSFRHFDDGDDDDDDFDDDDSSS